MTSSMEERRGEMGIGGEGREEEREEEGKRGERREGEERGGERRRESSGAFLPVLISKPGIA